MHSFPVPVLSPAVSFLSLFPDSLPQPFLRCSLSAFASRVFLFRSASFRPLHFRFQLLSLLFLPFCSPAVPPHSCFPARRLRSRFLGFPVLSRLISHAFHPGSLTQLRCPFPFVLPCFAPAAVPQVIPFRIPPPGPVPDFRFLASASVLASHYSASVLPFRSSRLHLTAVPRCAVSALASSAFPVLSGSVSLAFVPVPVAKRVILVCAVGFPDPAYILYLLLRFKSPKLDTNIKYFLARMIFNPGLYCIQKIFRRIAEERNYLVQIFLFADTCAFCADLHHHCNLRIRH